MNEWIILNCKLWVQTTKIPERLIGLAIKICLNGIRSDKFTDQMAKKRSNEKKGQMTKKGSNEGRGKRLHCIWMKSIFSERWNWRKFY